MDRGGISLGVVAHALVVALVPMIGIAGDVVVGDAYARHFQRDRIRFDGVQQVLLSFPYRAASDCTEPAVAWARADDGRAGSFCPLKDLPEANRLDIAVDSRGDVYALGHRMDGPTKTAIVHYSSEGNVVREQERTSLRAPLARLARTRGGTRAVVMAAVGDGRGLLAQLHISGKTKTSFALARLPLDGGPPTIVEPADGGELGTMQVPLIGRNGDATLFLNRYTATILQR